MINRLADLERQTRKHSTAQKNMAKTRRTRRGQYASRQFSQKITSALNQSFQYRIPGTITVMAQPSSMACWATVFTMLQTWRMQQSLTIEEALREVGQRWVTVYTNNTGLSAADKVDFVREAQLVAEPPMSHSVDGWRHMLETYGPMWVTTDEDPTQNFAIHARIIVGMHGDGTPDNTVLSIIDPAGGREYDEHFSVFLPKYEEEVRRTGRTRIQVIHWREEAQIALKQSQQQSRVNAFVPSYVQSQNALNVAQFPELQSNIAQLRQEGVSEAQIQAFLADFSMSMSSVHPQSFAGTTVTLPGGTVLEHWQASLFMTAVGSVLSTTPAGPVFAALIPAIQALCTRLNVTVGIGPAVTGGVAAGAGFGVGIIFAPGNRVGFYGSRSAVLGAIVSISGTFQVTIVHGGPSVFSGSAVLVGLTVGTDIPVLPVGVTGGVHAIMNMSGQFFGVTFEMGIAAGLSPLEVFAQYQHTSGTLAVATSYQARPSHAMSSYAVNSFANDLPPLSPAVGGQSIGVESLQLGDIILSTTTSPVSIGIRLASASPVSHSALYIGDGQIIEAVGEGVVLRQLGDALADDSVAVAVRHPNLTSEQALRVRDFAGQQLDRPYNTFGIVRHAALAINRQRCALIPHAGLRQACEQGMARIHLGTPDNQRFFCSQLVAAAYEAAGVPLTNTRVNWVRPADLANMREDQVPEVDFNIQLEYVGHLKA